MLKKPCLIIYGTIGGVFLFLDQYLKYFARANQEITKHFLSKWFGWEYLANSGVAFSIPLPNLLVIFLTPIVLLIIVTVFVKQKRKHPLFSLALCLIVAGAISNFVDRLFFKATIDYIRIFWSVINLADVVIVAGACIWVFGYYRYIK